MSRSAPTPITTDERNSFMNGFRDIFQAIHNDHPNWGPSGRSLEYVLPFFEAIITRILENYSRPLWDERAQADLQYFARERDTLTFNIFSTLSDLQHIYLHAIVI